MGAPTLGRIIIFVEQRLSVQTVLMVESFNIGRRGGPLSKSALLWLELGTIDEPSCDGSFVGASGLNLWLVVVVGTEITQLIHKPYCRIFIC